MKYETKCAYRTLSEKRKLHLEKLNRNKIERVERAKSDIIRLYKENLNIDEIKRRTKVPIDTIYKIIKENGIPKRGGKNINLCEKNGQWKGHNVGIDALHTWVRSRKTKPFICEICKKIPPYDLANISGEYKRDVNDFKWLCRSCHKKFDLNKRNNNHEQSTI